MSSLMPYKVCNSTRRTRHIVFASGTITDLLEKATDIFQRPFQRIVLESEGCELSSDMALAAFNKELLMLLESSEAWNTEGLYTTMSTSDSQTTDCNRTVQNEEVIQDASIEQIAVSTGQDTQTDTSVPLLQIDPNVISALLSTGSQRFSVPDPATMKLFAVEDQSDLFQQPSTSKQENVIMVNLQESTDQLLNEVSTIDADEPMADENKSPNSTTKRPRIIKVEKSTKKHASSEMKFRSFEINWNKFSDIILAKLNKLQEFKAANPQDRIPSALRLASNELYDMVNCIVDQLRAIDTTIQASVMEAAAVELIKKHPSLKLVDDDGYGNGLTVAFFKSKMIARNNYKNRFVQSKKKIPAPSKERKVRAGTLEIYWKNSREECDNEVLSKLRLDEPASFTEEWLEASQGYVRYLLDEKKDLEQLLSDYPVVRRRVLMNYHFEKATNVSVDDLRKYYENKRSKIISYSTVAGKKYSKLKDECSDLQVFTFLACLVGEKISDLIENKEIGTRTDDIKLDSAGPLLVSVDLGQDTSMYYVYVEQTRVTEGTTEIIEALQDLMCVQFVHNFMYIQPASKFLELVQRYLLKIIPETGTKSNAYRLDKNQRVVQRIIEKLSAHECK